MNKRELLKKWNAFKENLPHTEGIYAKRNWGSSLHSLCSYQGKLKPALAFQLVKNFTNEGDLVLDPFSGSGTIPFEAAMNNRRAIGFDISDMSVAISNGKIKQTSEAGCEKVINDLEIYLSNNSVSQKSKKDSVEVAFNKTIEEYFEPETFEEILKARDFFIKTKDFEDGNWCLVFSSMLHILHGNRPYALSRRSHPLTPYAPTGEYERKPVIKHLSDKVFKSISEKRRLILSEANCLQQDILGTWDKSVKGVNAIITSPPFVASTKFYMTNWMRFWFAGWGKEDFQNAISDFVEVKQKKDINVYRDIFTKFNEVLADDGIVLLHVGKNKSLNMGEVLCDIAKDFFEVCDLFVEDSEEFEKHGLKDKGGTTQHQYLLLRKL
jgi:methylase of polypeptide subunit release factors